MIIGGTALDITAKMSAPQEASDGSSEPISELPFLNTSSPGSVRKSVGGVGRNLVETVWRLGVPVTFVSALGDDPDADWLLRKDLSKMDLVCNY